MKLKELLKKLKKKAKEIFKKTVHKIEEFLKEKTEKQAFLRRTGKRKLEDTPEKKTVSLEKLPTSEDLGEELRREKYKNKYFGILKSTFYALVIVAAFSVLVATLLLPVLKIYGNSMTPTLNETDIVISVKTNRFKQGDIVAFYFNNHILVKRIIAQGGQTVYIDKEGTVYVDGLLIDEPYISEKSIGDTDIEYPFTVPDGTYFVLGDHRGTSVDSRSTVIGCINIDEVVGKIIFTVWPLSNFGTVN